MPALAAEKARQTELERENERLRNHVPVTAQTIAPKTGAPVVARPATRPVYTHPASGAAGSNSGRAYDDLTVTAIRHAGSCRHPESRAVRPAALDPGTGPG